MHGVPLTKYIEWDFELKYVCISDYDFAYKLSNKKVLSILGMTSERKLSLKSDLHLVLFNIVGSNGMS